MKILKPYILVILALLIVSCATRQSFEKREVPEAAMRSFMAGKSARLRPDYQRLLEEGNRNRVLNDMRLGLDALQLGSLGEAEKAFAEATGAIDAVYSNNPEAAKARSLWYEEGQKDFKGEPYERAMAFFYLGLIDALRKDYENARASFKSGILQDAFAEEEQNRCDFASLIYLSGWVSKQNGDDELARAAFAEVKSLRGDFTPPSNENCLLLVETGTSPRKVADGSGHAELKFRRGRNFTEEGVMVSVDGAAWSKAYPIEDLYWQSTSRGGRPVDKIVKGKARFRNTNAEIGSDLSSVSDKLLLSGAALSAAPGLTYAGAALGLVSVTQMALAARTRAYADIRYWDNLPDRLHIMPLNLSAGTHTLYLIFTNHEGRHLPELDRTMRVEVGADQAPIFWLRSRELSGNHG